MIQNDLIAAIGDVYGAPFVKIVYLTDLAQKLLSLHAEMLSVADMAISTCRDVISGRDSYLCMQRCFTARVPL